VGWAEKVGVGVIVVGGCGGEGTSIVVGGASSGARRPRWARRKSRVGNVPGADCRSCGGSGLGSWWQGLVWVLGRREEEVRGSAWFHLHIRCVRARFLCGSGMVVALVVLELVEFVWHRWVSVSSSVEEGWLAGVIQLEHGGDVGAGAVGIRSQGALI